MPIDESVDFTVGVRVALFFYLRFLGLDLRIRGDFIDIRNLKIPPSGH